MRIENITLSNYRQYKDVNILFPEPKNFDLNIFVGTNGVGKTNILNAINWCLYGDEPHLSKNSQNAILPLINIKTIDNMKDGQDINVSVSLKVMTDNGVPLTFKRENTYTIYRDKQKQILKNSIMKVTIISEKGNTKIIGEKEEEKDEVDILVKRFVPLSIREYFFFDGEHLEKYFQEETGQKINNAVMAISKIEDLKKIDSRLSNIADEYRRKAGSMDPEVEKKRKKLEEEDNLLKERKKKLEEIKTQSFIAKKNKDSYEEKLRGLPNIELVERRRKELSNINTHLEKLRVDKIREKENYIYENGIYLSIFNGLKNVVTIIDTKKENNELPPINDKDLLEKILHDKECKLCLRKLDPESTKNIEKLLQDINISSQVGSELLRMDVPVHNFYKKIINFKSIVKRHNDEIEEIDQEFERNKAEITQINQDLEGYNSDQIKDYHRKRIQFEDLFVELQRGIGEMQAEIRGIESNVVRYDNELRDEMDTNDELNKIKIKVDFCNKALECIKNTQDQILQDIKNKILTEMKRNFLNLTWKKSTFKDIEVDDNYNFNLIHMDGYPMLGSISKAENELLALSFTLALHKISGFDSPIIIDTPVARVSDIQRENFGKTLLEMSKHKQIILLFTKDEYSKNISEVLEPNTNSNYKIELSSDEKEANVKKW